MPAGLTTAILDTFKDQDIKTVCPYSYTAKNHCAHFVSHVLGLKSGTTCGGLTVEPELRTKYNAVGASIRVNEIFNLVGGGQKIDVAAATAALAAAAATPTMTSTTAGAVAVSTSSGTMATVPTLTATTAGAAAVSSAGAAASPSVPPTECLIYATLDGYVKAGKMGDGASKHIGIYFNGTVYHYSNGQKKVVTQTLAQFSQHYGKKTVLYYTGFPAGANAVALATAATSALPAGSYIVTTDKKGNTLLKKAPKTKAAVVGSGGTAGFSGTATPAVAGSGGTAGFSSGGARR